MSPGLIRRAHVKRMLYTLRPTEAVGLRVEEICMKEDEDVSRTEVLNQLLEWGLEEYDKRATAQSKGKVK